MLIIKHRGRAYGIGLEAEVHSQKTEQEGIDARRFFDPGPVGSSTHSLAVM